MKILRCIAGFVCVLSFLAFSSCNKSSPAATLGDWVKSAPFEGVPRAGAFAFTIGGRAYVGLGHDGINYQNDCYFYDETLQYWDSIATFPGLGREQSIAFSANGKGYVGTGYNRDSVVQLKDFWEYDPQLNKWKQLNDFRGGGRSNAVGFDDGVYGYVGTGYNNNWLGDFWKYDPTQDSWTKIAFSGDKRAQAMTMTIKGKTYLFGGLNNGSLTLDMWEFDPTAQAWTNLTPLTTDAQYTNFKAAVSRYDAVAFSLNNFGYITTGSNGAFLSTTYQYDPVLQTYTLMTPFERAARTQAVAFVIGDASPQGYVVTGLQGTFHFDDMMEFFPLNAYVLNN